MFPRPVFRFAIGPFEVVKDHDYGIDRRTGWTTTWNGSVYVGFAPTLMCALWRTMVLLRRYRET